MSGSTGKQATGSSKARARRKDVSSTGLGFVVIGRNEGPRLRLCMESILRFDAPIVYADSGSADDSVRTARRLGATVVEVDRSSPFTAARGRNAGFERMSEEADAEFVQFVDGDCQIARGWPAAAIAALERDPKLGLVCGLLREKNRSSIYARLLDMEWQGPVGPIAACGGIFMIRTEAFRAVGGFTVGHAAGEEADLCVRLSRGGWKLERISAEMATHDANMTRFRQWWRRAVRSGWAYAKAAMPWNPEFSFRSVRRIASTLSWAVGLPGFAAAVTIWQPWPLGALACALAFLGFAALFLRVRGHRLRAGNSPRDAELYAAFCILGKWAETIGFLKYWVGR